MKRKISLLFIFCGIAAFHLNAQNVPTQKRAESVTALEVMTFNADSTYDSVKELLDKWELKYDDADLFYKTELIIKDSYFKGMAVKKIVVAFGLKTRFISKVYFNVTDSSVKELDAYVAELSKKYPYEKIYDCYKAKNGFIKRNKNELIFYFDKRPVLKSAEEKK